MTIRKREQLHYNTRCPQKQYVKCTLIELTHLVFRHFSYFFTVCAKSTDMLNFVFVMQIHNALRDLSIIENRRRNKLIISAMSKCGVIGM